MSYRTQAKLVLDTVGVYLTIVFFAGILDVSLEGNGKKSEKSDVWFLRPGTYIYYCFLREDWCKTKLNLMHVSFTFRTDNETN